MRRSPPLTQVVLAVGTSAGRVRLLAPATGGLLLSQRLHASAVRGLSTRAACWGCSLDDPAEDFSVAFAGALVRVDGWEARA